MHHQGRTRPPKGKRRNALGLAAVVVGALVLPAAASANTVTITGSMEGAITISSGDWVNAGYSFNVQGSHPSMTVYFKGAQISFTGRCSGMGTDTLTLHIPDQSYSVPADSNAWYPAGGSGEFFQFAQKASVCGGHGGLDASSGAAFSADVQSTDTADNLQVRFHYRDPAAKGKGNTDCTATTNAPADVCGASWSGTASLVPDTPTPPPAPPTTPTAPTPPTKPVTTQRHKRHKHAVKPKKISRPPKKRLGFTG